MIVLLIGGRLTFPFRATWFQLIHPGRICDRCDAIRNSVAPNNEPFIIVNNNCLYITFTDGSFLTATTQMWGAMELYNQGDELNREYIKDMRPTPLDAEFTFDYFSDLIVVLVTEKSAAQRACSLRIK